MVLIRIPEQSRFLYVSPIGAVQVLTLHPLTKLVHTRNTPVHLFYIINEEYPTEKALQKLPKQCGGSYRYINEKLDIVTRDGRPYNEIIFENFLEGDYDS